MVRLYQQLLPVLLLSYLTNSAFAAASRMRTDSTSSGRGRTVSTASSQCYSPREDDTEDFDVLAGNPSNSAMHIACCKPDCSIETLTSLLAGGGDINQRNDQRQTPIMLACHAGADATVIQFLIDQGAAIERQCDAYWKSLLHYACEGGNITVITLLLERYNLPILSCRLRHDQTVTDMGDSPAVKELILFHKEKREREHREAYADSLYEEIGPKHLIGMPSVAEEEDFELIDPSEATDA